MAETLYQKRTKVRRMSDIERLAQQYSKNIESMTGQYQQSFADYQKMVAEKMAPYESEVKRYQTELMPADGRYYLLPSTRVIHLLRKKTNSKIYRNST